MDHSWDGYHTYTLELNENGLETKVDGKPILTVSHNNPHKHPKTVYVPDGYWNYGNFPSGLNNPWDGRKNAPFDQEFYIIMNLATNMTSIYHYFKIKYSIKFYKIVGSLK